MVVLSSDALQQLPVVSLNLPDSTALHRAFMPFIEGGGLFIATSEDYQLADQIKVTVHVMQQAPVTFIGTVVWISPAYAQDGRSAGIGVQWDAATSETLLPIISVELPDTASFGPNHTM